MSKVNYYSFTNPAPVPVSNAGSGIVDVYQLQLVKGDTKLVKTGTRDMYAIIQSHKKSTDINYILERAKNDPRYLNNSTAQYLDLTQMPSNIYEAAEMIQKAQESFLDLPLAIREKFNHNPNEMIKAFDKGEMPQVIKDYVDSNFVKNNDYTKPVDNNVVKSEVVENVKE